MADVDEDSDIDECSGISQPTLLEQIRTILDDYRNDVQIIKELIQNADDAGASEMKILYIETELNKDVVRNENVLKGPALVVYNNAKFTEQDWRGITSIYSSVKRNDPLKVGRFGLGFKSVFHMTDNPCIISDCNILFINPLEKENDKVCVQVKLKHLKKSKRLDFSNIMKALNGIFEFSESTISDGIYPGTLFWFSLRQRPSELSSDIYDKEQVNGILGAFSEESSRSLIFLKTLCVVDVFVLPESDKIPKKGRRTSLHNSSYGQREHYLSTSIYNADANEPKSLVEKRKETLNDMEKIGMSIPKKPSYWLFDVIIETMSSLHGDHSKTTKSRWVIILYHKGEPIRNETQLLLKEKDLQYSPLVGLAAPINKTGDYTNIISHVFCYQPLPQENASGTGIPVYVNAFFALGQNRRQIRWPDIDKKGEEIVTDDIKIKWNKALRTEFLPYAYVQLCCELVRLSKTMKNDKHFVQAVYNVIPNLKLSEGHWKHLAEEVVKLIEDETTIFTESKDGVWIKPSEANLIDKEEFSKLGKFGKETQDTVFTLLRKDNKNVSDVPHNVMYSLRKIHSDKLTFVTPRLLKQHLNENASYTSLSFNEKVRLMKFILQDESSDLLENLELVPLADTSFTTFSGGQVFLENSDVIKLFPGKEMKFVYGDLDENSKQRLGQLLEKDECSVSYMNATDTRNLLKVILNERFDNQHGCYRVEDQWLKEVWSLIQNKYMEQIDSFADLHLFPIYRKIGKNDSAVEKVIPINSLIYVKPAQIDASIVNLFRYLSVYVVQNVPRCIDERVIERYIYRDTLEDLQSLFGKVADPDIDVLNKHISTSDSNMFLGFLSERMQKNSGRIKHKLENMKLFLSGRQRDKCSLRCIAECQKLYKGQSLPIPFPVDVIFLNNETQIRFAESIGGQVTSDYDMVLFTLERIDTYSPLEKDKLIKWVLQSHFVDKNDVQIFLKSISFVPTKGGQLHKASELFDPEDKCLATFVNELDVFPTKEYKKHIKSLKKLGLKTIKNITESDIYIICKEIDKKWNPNIDLRRYKNQYITLRNEVLEKFSNKIIKAKLLNKRCIINQNNELCCPADLISSKYRRLVDTEMSVIENCSEIPELCKLFGWDDPPSLERVIKHFCNIVKVYKTGKITIIDLLPSIDDIYGFLSEHENYVNKTLQDHFSSLGNTYVWTGDGFESPKRVYINSSDSDIDLRPFFYQLPKQFIQYHHLFCSLGCKQNIDAEMYLDTLSIINENCVNHEKSCSDTKLLKMAVDILTKVYDDHIDYVGSSEREIYFPVQNKNKEILMKPAKECTYCDADWLKDMDFDENEEVHDVHEKVHKDIAEGLGVPSLRQQMLSESDAFEEWGQEEPLTRRLRNLLDNDYVDGFSVAKELVQNADDAGAKCLKIMYDDRENNDLRTQLLCENMAELQGPAIWVYNDARFTDTDFKNITKISGGTKKSDSSTIGRFGLGFCSVYNMTDVPSLLSCSSFVMFDPHTTYLGRALPGKSPGLRINFDNERNKKLLKRLKNQFRTYDDIFDCQITTTDSAFFNGTLFRLPLRNRASDICDIVYTKEKVKRLFETIETCASNMLLFSQNVQEIELYYLSTKKNKVLDHVLMFSTSKQILSTGSDLAIPSSILKKASEMKEKGDISTQALNVLEDINIQTKSMPGRNSLFKRAEIEQIEYSWLVSWSTGTKPKTLEITRNETGALPIGAVAVPYHRNKNGYIISPLNELPVRFYQEGYFFFFLPLPISHKFQFHINGQFEVSSDRQSLRISTEGLKNVVKKEWNECIMNDAVTHALLHLLTKLRGVVDMSKYDCFHLWPTSKESVSCHMTESFYHQLMGQTLHSIFLKNKSWFDFSKCMFLETDLRHSDVGENALKTLDTLNKSVGFEVIDVPDNVYDLLMEADNTLFKSKTISKVQFYTKYFLPNIDHFNAKQLINMRDSLVKYALNINISDINTTLKKIPCIPCKPNGKLRRPSELVDEKEFLQLFSDTDEFFPHVRFSKSVERLRNLGMMHDTLTNEMVLYSAKSVERLHNQSSGGAVDRSIALVDYLNAHMDHHTDIFEQLQCIQFMPIATKPEKWPFKWKLEDILETEQEVFLATKDLYRNKCMYLVGSLSLVLHHRVSEKINDELAQTLGIHLDCDLETVLEQLILMAKTYDDNDPESATPHFDKIYQHLEGKPIQTEHLRHENIVWVPNTLTNVGKVSLDMTDDCSPYLFSLKNSPLKKYPQLYYSLGIEKTFHAKKYAETLQEIKEKFGENPLEESEIKIVLNLLTCFVKTNEWREFNGVIYGPDNSCILCDCKTMCFNDFDDIEKSETMRYSHPDMPMSLAKKLGVKPKLTHSMDENSEDIEDFYQEEPLVVRIQNLIEGYPCDTGVFKELIQNADDANASEIHFLLDLDKCPIQKIFEGRYYELQGPALCIFNDSSFSNNDLDGIKRLGRGNKAEDSFKTGRYGVGFNAVYNLTDVPSFLTWGGDIEKNGETLCFFDPMGRYIPGVTKQKPGKRFKDVATIRKFKNDVIKGYHENFFKDFSRKTGSVFRLPLRTYELVRHSDITKESVEPGKVRLMLDELMMELKHIVLFLKHLFTVRITIHKNGTYAERYMMKRNFIEIERFQHFLKKQKEFSRSVSQNPKEMFNMECVNEVFDLKITESFVISQNERQCENHDFVISNSIGFKYVSEIPQFLHENIVSGKACIFPNGAVAMDKNITEEMKAFCFLPLPITTGLPVHVHGYFALDNETRRTLWHAEKESQCYKTLWNVELMKQTIAPAYASLLNFMKERMLHVHSVSSVMEFSEVTAHLRRYMSILPSDDKTCDFYWEILTYAVYKELVKQEAEFLPVLMSFKNKRRSSDVVSGKLNWTTLKTNGQTFPAYRNDDTSFSEKTNSFPDLELLDKLGLRSVTIFDDIQRTMENAKCSIGTLKPAHVIRFIASFQDDIFDRCRIEVNKNVEDTVLCNKFNVRQLLRYCLRDTDTFIANLFRMPLFLTLNGILRVLPEDEYFLVETNESFCKFFPTASGRFLMSEISGLICHKLESYQTISKGILQPFTLHKFVDLVKETDTLPCGNSIISWDKKTPTEGWIKKFWEFFYRSYSEGDHSYNCDVRAHVRRYIQIIDNLPLFPVNNNQYLVNSYYLKQLVNLESFEVNPTLKRTLEKVNLMTLTEEMFELPCHRHGPNTISVFQLLCFLLPDYKHPGEIVTCLHMNAEKVQNAGLIVEEVIVILRYFVETDVLDRSFGSDIGTQLRDLPLFVTHFNEIVSLKKYDVICLAPRDIPSDGLKELAQNSNVLFLKNIGCIEDFYVKIGIKTASLVDIYVQYIIPKYGDMNRLAFYKHVAFLAGNSEYADNTNIQSALRDTPFILVGTNSLQVKYFFNPEYKLFKRMCDYKELIPESLRDTKTLRLLEKIGLQTTLTISLLERFTKSIAKKSQIEEQHQTAIGDSILLLKSLFKMEYDFFVSGNFSSIINIKFIKPMVVKNELSKIHPQYNPHGFICFQDAVIPDEVMVCWSSSELLPENVPHNETILNKLGIRKIPTFTQLVTHCKNIGVSAKQKGKSFSHECLEKVMLEVYDHLDKFRQSTDISDKEFMTLCDVPLIYHKISKDLFTPRQVVITCKENVEEIPPFITRCPIEYVRYQDLLCLMGCWKEPSCEMYASVLNALKHHVDECGQLLPKELSDAVKAQGLFFKYLTELTMVDEIDVQNIVLLNEKEGLQSARSLVINDNNIFKRKIDDDNTIQCSFLYLSDKLGDVRVDKNRLLECLKYLPERTRPCLLTAVAKLKVNLDRSFTKDTTPVNELNEFLHGRDFVHGYLRLIKHALKNNNESRKWNESDEKRIAERISNTTCKHIGNIETSLFFKPVDGPRSGQELRVNCTEEKQSVHIEEKDSVATIFFDTSNNKWFNKVKMQIAVLLNKFANCCLGDVNLMILVELIELKDQQPSTISTFLDQKAIDEYESTVEINTSPLYPIPGTFVPRIWHKYLDNDYGIFQEYDFKFVALEIDDPAQEDVDNDNEDESELDSTYIFVHIIKKSENLNQFPLLQEYEINDGTETTYTVPAYRLYKFIASRSVNTDRQLVEYGGPSDSSNNSFPNDIKVAFKEVREYLINAWKEPESVRRKLVLRLLRKWHPDKNPDNVDFCTKVFQYIQICLQRLENGENLSDEFSDSQANKSNFSSSSTSYWGSSWFGRYWRRHRNSYRRQRTDYDDCDGFTNFSGFSWSSHQEPFPWKSEARRWYKQALSDLTCARKASLQEDVITYNWICYMCHQASEKCLKAARYAIDSNKVHGVKYGHDLTFLASELNSNIRTLSRDLSNLTGYHTRMRYPDTLNGQTLPCDAYSEETALSVIQKADAILNAVNSAYIN
ncbi:hypothetical protein ACF0H5_007241 [Mactra antiquata]